MVMSVERKVDSKYNGKFYMDSRNLDFLKQDSYLKEPSSLQSFLFHETLDSYLCFLKLYAC